MVGPNDVFARAAHLTDGGYDVSIASIDGEPTVTSSGIALATKTIRESDSIDTLVLPGGPGVDAARAKPENMDWIRTASSRARRTVSICTGVFFAAQAGLLDGCPATTHWSDAERLALEFPAIDVDPDPIFLRSAEAVWTAAGVASGMDLALALVEDDHGTEVAQQVARWLVLYLRRPGGQTQFAAPVWTPRAKHNSIRSVQEAIEAEPAARHSITNLARSATMSPRHFSRVFTDEVGEAPGAYVERIRVEAARRQLEECGDTVATIATRCGFGTAETLRRTFIRRVGVSPNQYRKMFT